MQETDTARAPEAPAPELTMVALAELPPDTPLTAADLGRLLKRNPQTIQRAASRGDLPAPFKFLGRHAWTVAAVLAHLGRAQAAALAGEGRRSRARTAAQP